MSEYDRMIGQEGGPPRPGGNINDWQAGQLHKETMDRLAAQRRESGGGQKIGFGALVFILACCYFGYKDITKGKYDSSGRATPTAAELLAHPQSRSTRDPAANAVDATIAVPAAKSPPSAATDPGKYEMGFAKFLAESGATPEWSGSVAHTLISVLPHDQVQLLKNGALYSKEGDPARAFIIPLATDSPADQAAAYCYSVGEHVVFEHSTISATSSGPLLQMTNYVVTQPDGRAINAAQVYAQQHQGCFNIFYAELDQLRTEAAASK